jgi:hypothetical protein
MAFSGGTRAAPRMVQNPVANEFAVAGATEQRCARPTAHGLFVGEVLVEAVDQADERYAESAVYRFRLGRRVIGENLHGHIGVAY